jgi:glyoxalase family protein
MQLSGMHHVTAVTAQATQNLAFYTQTLGLRLVKRTVNQDDVSSYHLFYGDAVGSAGSDITFFDWPHAAERHHGSGSVICTGFRVNGRAALAWWADRFVALGVAHQAIVEWNGRAVLPFSDFEGQALALVDDGGHGLATPWDHTDVPVQFGLRGLGPPLLCVTELEPTARVLCDVLNFRQSGSYELVATDVTDARPVHVFETGDGGASAEIHVVHDPSAPRGRVGRGGVHHIAFRTPSVDEHTAWRERIAGAHIGVTPVIDRYYFRSLYFREPSGVLFEIATDGPGFDVDEPVTALGEHLSLPPFLESRRNEIESMLQPLGDGETSRVE